MIPRTLSARVLRLLIVAPVGSLLLLAASHQAPVSADPSDSQQAPKILVQAQPQPDRPAIDRRRQLDTVRNWGYWLSSFEVASVAAAPHDLLVVDSEISADRTFERQLTPAEVARMKHRRDGSPRVLFAYLSIGEAERYRPYWQQDWYDPAKKPAWLGSENRRWAGNFAVQYWHPEWQQLIFGTPESHLDRIIAQGFDGVYLDRADAFFEWKRSHPSARADMATFIARLAEHARKRNPQFLIVMQNAEELLEDSRVLEAIDGTAKEDLLYGVRRAEEANKPDDVSWSIDLLQMAQGAGRKVLVVEYLKDRAKMAAAASRIRDEGFVPYFAPRQLSCLNPPAMPDSSGALPEHHCR